MHMGFRLLGVPTYQLAARLPSGLGSLALRDLRVLATTAVLLADPRQEIGSPTVSLCFLVRLSAPFSVARVR